MSSHGVSLTCPSNDFSGSLRDSIALPLSFSITIRFGSKIERLSWPGNSVTTRSVFAFAVITTLFRQSGWLFTYQIAPVIEAAILTVLTLFQRSSPPCAFTARFNNSFTLTPLCSLLSEIQTTYYLSPDFGPIRKTEVIYGDTLSDG